jgi:hypothetical protein
MHEISVVMYQPYKPRRTHLVKSQFQERISKGKKTLKILAEMSLPTASSSVTLKRSAGSSFETKSRISPVTSIFVLNYRVGLHRLKAKICASDAHLVEALLSNCASLRVAVCVTLLFCSVLNVALCVARINNVTVKEIEQIEVEKGLYVE